MACSMATFTFTFTSLLLTESRPLKAIVLVLLVEIFTPYLKVTVSSLCTEIRSASPESAVVRQQKCFNIFISCSSDSFYSLFFPFCNNLRYLSVKWRLCKWQPCGTPAFIALGCVKVAPRFTFIHLFSHSCIIAVSNGLGAFLDCKMLNSSLLISSKIFS